MNDSDEEERGGGGGNLLDQEADESSDDSSSSSDSEEEEEGDEEGDVEGLIDDTVEGAKDESGGEEGSGEDSEIEMTKKDGKRRRSFEDDQLDDEDYALIAENTGIELKRKKLRRVHMLDSDEEDEEGVANADTAVGGEPPGATPMADDEDLSNDAENFSHIFGDSDEEEGGDSLGSGSKKQSYLDDMDDEDDDFIVDEQGQPIRRRKGDGTYTEPALVEAQEIFGLDFDPAEFEKLAKEGLESGDEDEEEDQYEDSDAESEMGDSQRPKKKRRRGGKKKTGIYDLYEPSELERGHFLEKDAEIRVTDMPERFQTRSIPVKPSEEGELEEEAEWVFENAFVKPPISKQPYFTSDRHHNAGPRGPSPQVMVPKVKEALNFMRNHSFEVPYIANYRREYIEPELDVHDLWKIYQWDEKWLQLKTRKQDMRRLFERMRDYQFEKVKEEPDKALTEDTRVLTDEDIMRLESVSSSEELSDVYAHFTLYYGKDLVAMRNRQAKKATAGDDIDTLDVSLDDSQEKNSGGSKKTTVKQAHRRDFYAICQENGLGSLAAKYGLTPEQFGENLRDNYQRHETEQHNIEPEESAEDYIQPTGFFSSVRAVLQGACHMVAMQIAAEPLVRQSLRQAFQSRAVICVKPTKKGRKMVDDSHPCYPMKYLRNKPIKELKGDEFLKLVQAEEDRLLEIKISIDRDLGPEKRLAGQTYFEDIRQLFYRDEFSRLVEKWNAQRAQAVAHALLKVLYPLMEKEMRNKLLLEAKEHVLQSCVHSFRKWLDVAPPTFNHEDSMGEGPYARVLACAYTPDKTVPAFCCFLDNSGLVTDFLRLNNLLKRKYSPFDREREEKEGDLKTLKDFISNKRPDLIVVGAESRECISIVEEFREMLTELEQEEDVGVVPVELMDPNVARIYSKTNRAKEEYSEYPELLRMAVSLGRRLQEPLIEFTALASSPDEEIFALKMHPLQDSLPKEKLRDALELELVTRVNDVGVDVNFVLNYPHASSMLNYVCGLGPRKAAALLKTLKQENAQLHNRSQLVMQCSFGPHIFINCVGFIKIDCSAFIDQDSSTYIEVLDSTRIHPETYVWARKMAVDALEYDEVIGDENNPSIAVEEILTTPDKLSDLDLDAFAEELERQDYGNKKTTLYDIRNELFTPFKERRQAYTPMSEEEKFSLLTGETPESLHEGKLVICSVVGIVRRKPPREVLDRANPIQNEQTHLWQCPFCLLDNFRDLGHVWQHFDDGSCPGQGIGVRTRLENGLSGFIHTRNLSDKHVSAPEERVHIGMAIHCRILRVNLERFSVDLTCKSSDLLDKEGRFSLPKDIYYNHDLAESDRKKEEGAQKKPQQKYFKRVIVHPSFMNCSFTEAEKTLSNMDQGDAIFRPSSKGSDRLTLTWKLDDGIHIHVDIKEQNKPNQFSLGRSLWIGNDEYEDLDEILARYVQPIAANAREVLSHKCYRKADGGSVDSLKKLLRDEKSKNPKRIPYFFSASKQIPGKFCLAYQPGSKPRIEYVTVTGDGFRYRNKVLRSVNELIKWFKEHFQDPIPRPAPSTTAITGSQIPSHITQNVDPGLYSKLQAAVNTAHQQQRGSGQTPYTPTHLAYSTGTPTPQYAQQQPFPQQPYHGGGGGYGGAANQYAAGSHPYGGPGGQFGYQRGGPGGYGGGGGLQAGWTPSHAAMMRTPAQTPGRTPAYTPSQTPHSMTSSSLYTPTPRSGGRGHRHGSPMGTPLLDE